jgi:hypothetical protein
MLKRLFRAFLALAMISALFGTGAATTLKGNSSRDAKELSTGSHDHGSSANSELSNRQTKRLARKLARARVATAEYATDLDAAKADGYRIITRMIPDMGFHFLNPDIAEFDVEEPPILVYAKRGGHRQLVAFEWVFPEKPAKNPLPGARYGSFGAACHYNDGTFYFEESEGDCDPSSPESGAPFFFWHPDLVTLHLWAWYHNPDGIYNGTNPLMRPFNQG